MRQNNMIAYLVGTLFLLSFTVCDSGHAQVVTLPDIDISGISGTDYELSYRAAARAS